MTQISKNAELAIDIMLHEAEKQGGLLSIVSTANDWAVFVIKSENSDDINAVFEAVDEATSERWVNN